MGANLPPYLTDTDPSPEPGLVTELKAFDPELRFLFDKRDHHWGVYQTRKGPWSQQEFFYCILDWCGEDGGFAPLDHHVFDLLNDIAVNRTPGGLHAHVMRRAKERREERERAKQNLAQAVNDATDHYKSALIKEARESL